MRRLIVAAALVAGLSACGGHDDTAGSRAGTVAASATAAASRPTSTTDTLVAAGVSQLKAGDTATAKASFLGVLALDAKNVYALYNLGLIAQEANDETTAKAYYEKALASDANYAPALFNEAIVLERSDLAKSVELYQRAVDADPTLAAAYIRLGFALDHEGRTEDAAKARAQGLALDPALAKATAPSY